MKLKRSSLPSLPPCFSTITFQLSRMVRGCPTKFLLPTTSRVSGVTIFICKTRTFGVCPHACPRPVLHSSPHCLCWPSLMGSGCTCSAHHNSGHNTQIPQKQCSTAAERTESVERAVVGGHLAAGTFAAVGRTSHWAH